MDVKFSGKLPVFKDPEQLHLIRKTSASACIALYNILHYFPALLYKKPLHDDFYPFEAIE